MVDTIISLTMVMLLLLGILVMDDAFLSIQTAETANFFASRADVVEEDSGAANQFFQKNVLRQMVFTHPNEFLTIDPITIDSNDRYIETQIVFHSKIFKNTPFKESLFLNNCKLNKNRTQRGFCTSTSRIEMPE